MENGISIMISSFSILVTVLIGFQIWKAIDISKETEKNKQEFEKIKEGLDIKINAIIDEKIKIKLETINTNVFNLEKSAKGSYYQLIAELNENKFHFQHAFNYYLTAALNFSLCKETYNLEHTLKSILNIVKNYISQKDLYEYKALNFDIDEILQEIRQNNNSEYSINLINSIREAFNKAPETSIRNDINQQKDENNTNEN